MMMMMVMIMMVMIMKMMKLFHMNYHPSQPSLDDPCPWQMFSWWFTFCKDTARYRLWHPRDHVSGRWSSGYSDTPPEERGPEHVIGQSHIVEVWLSMRYVKWDDAGGMRK
jgi:hypothetical protein